MSEENVTQLHIVEEVEEEVNGNLFEELSKKFEEINPELGGFDEIGMLLALPDEQFNVLAPIFIAELEKSLNNISDKLILAQAFNASGVKIEEVRDNFVQLTNEIDGQLGETLTPVKRDFLKRMISITYNALSDTEGVTKRVIQVPLEKCREGAKVPTYANIGDAAVDLYAVEEITLQPGEQKIIPIGLKVELPLGYGLLVQPRSGLSARTKLRICNTPGLIDSGYRGEIGVICENTANKIEDIEYEFSDDGNIVIKSILHGAPITIGKGERFAQMRLVEVPTAAYYEVEKVHETARGQKGFGSSGTN